MKINFSEYKEEVGNELDDILSYWMKFTIDEKYGGFYGKIDNMNIAYPESEKGLVLNSRILWAFSAAYNYSNKEKYLEIADRAYKYIVNHFIDKDFGGAYWSVNYNGKMLNGRKQIYGIAFCIYGLSEYYKIKPDSNVLRIATNLFEAIEKYSYDKIHKGYYEAFARNWSPLEDLRLSTKDANEKKTMNTHLHIIEAYANLFEVWKSDFLKEQIEGLLKIFSGHIINDQTGNLNLFFDEEWNVKSKIISYGHDIEAAWLLQQCAEKINEERWVKEMKKATVKITDAAAKGLDEDGGLWYEFDVSANHFIREKHWWPQSEAMIGFMNAYQITGNEKYSDKSYNSWQFVRRYIKDNVNGEWFWGINADYSVMQDQDKAGFWKCPYHNTRACLEIIKRISSVTSN